mmetsp:Transcript_54487/g.117965  ORF Transcript_54487/g.117965 Transcript_54487/m.117965 type:complete len:207 (-) Transcript_54487:143-763(-)
MFQDKVEKYLRHHGLGKVDVPKVMGTFLAAKYCTWLVLVSGGVRYRPFSRLFQRRASPAFGKARIRLQKELGAHQTWQVPGHEAYSRLVEKASEQYQSLSQKLADRFANNRLWATVSELLAQDPRLLAVGLAEGTILYKLTFPVTAPLELYIIVRWFQYRRATEDEDDGLESHEIEDLRELAQGCQDSPSGLLKGVFFGGPRWCGT